MAASAEGDRAGAGEERAVDPPPRVAEFGPLLEREHLQQEACGRPLTFRAADGEDHTVALAVLGNLDPEHPRVSVEKNLLLVERAVGMELCMELSSSETPYDVPALRTETGRGLLSRADVREEIIQNGSS
jgi:hypothetical protein